MLLLDGGHVSSSPVRTSISGQSAKIAEPPDETVYEIFCEKSDVGSIRDTVTVTFDNNPFRHDITLPGIYEAPPYSRMEGVKYSISTVDEYNEIGVLWLCKFNFGDYYAHGSGIGNEEGTYHIEGNTITITITDSALPERIGMTFEVMYEEVDGAEHIILDITFTNAIMLTMGIAQEDTIRCLAY